MSWSYLTPTWWLLPLASKFSELCNPHQVISGPSSIGFLILVCKHWFSKAFDFDLSPVLSKDLLVLRTRSQPWLPRDRCSICHFPQYKGHFCSQDSSQSTGSQHQPQVWISIWRGSISDAKNQSKALAHWPWTPRGHPSWHANMSYFVPCFFERS